MVYTLTEHLIEDSLNVLVTGILGHVEELHQFASSCRIASVNRWSV